MIEIGPRLLEALKWLGMVPLVYKLIDYLSMVSYHLLHPKGSDTPPEKPPYALENSIS